MPKRKPSELTDVQLARFERCYSVYRKKKSRGQAEKTWANWDFDDEMTLKIEQAILAQNKAEELYCKPQFYRNFSTWLNDQAWKDEIPSIAEAKQNSKENGCHKCLWCNTEVKIKFTLCEEHANWYRENYGPSREERLKWFKAQGIVKEGMTKTEVMKAYRKSRDESLRKITQRVIK